MKTETTIKLTLEMKTVINSLNKNYTLINRGYGWLLAKPRKPSEIEDTKTVSKDTITKLISTGLIKTERTFFVLKTKLTKKAYEYMDAELQTIIH